MIDVNFSRLKKHWDMRPATGDNSYDNGRHHEHGLTEFDSISFESDKPFEEDRFRAFVAEIPPGVYRGKGILSIAGDNHRRIFQLVGERCDVMQGRPWLPGEKRRTQLVLIGRRLGDTDLQERLEHLVTGHSRQI